MTELKPCPFCGHPRSRLFYKREYCEDMEGRVAVRYRIWRACTRCFARGGFVLTEPQARDLCPRFEWANRYRADADAMWNRRDGELDAE